jgi:hypothetical protein
MLASKIFLTLIGGAYLALAAWCALKPQQTSQAVGFQLKPGNGQSEYFTVYGGLQLGLGLFFLWPWWQEAALPFVLGACMLIHACLVLMRSIAFGLYQGIPAMTVGFAVLEWGIFLAAAVFWWQTRPLTD